jgi:peptidoglycan-associated lipoprotein
MTRNGPILVALVAALSLAACSKKKPENLPPPAAGRRRLGHAGRHGHGRQRNQRRRRRHDRPARAAAPISSPACPSERILFETDSFSVDAEDRAILMRRAAWLQRYPSVRVTIEGHADERGTRE